MARHCDCRSIVSLEEDTVMRTCEIWLLIDGNIETDVKPVCERHRPTIVKTINLGIVTDDDTRLLN